MRTWLATAVLAASALLNGAAFAAEEGAALKSRDWPHAGPFGTFDRASLQRGYLVYRDVCATCHSMDFVAFRNLEEIGLSEEEVRALAAEFTVTAVDDDGAASERPGRPADRFPAPFANKAEAKEANGEAYPPDLSLLVKARVGHEDYLYSILTGYEEAPAGVELQPGLYYNPYFPGGQIAMPPPLVEDIVSYPDGTQASVEQMSYDVTNFLAWAAEPNLEERKRYGVKVVLFLAIFAGLLFVVKRKIWADVH